MQFELTANPPFSLGSVINSHGWIRLAPFDTIEGSDQFNYVIQSSNQQVVQLQISEIQNGVRVYIQEQGAVQAQDEIKTAVAWMLQLNEDYSQFYELTRREPKLSHVEEKAQGRLLRSPTLFEDTIKTILTTNTSWSGTIRMTDSLVTQFGSPLPGREGQYSFPGPHQVAISNEQTLRGETRLGYRAPFILELSRKVDSGALDLEKLKSSNLPTKELHKQLTSIRGVGNYAAAHLLMLLGHFDYLPIDSWALKMVSSEFFNGEPIQPEAVEQVFDRWGKWKGLAYWLWNWSAAGET